MKQDKPVLVRITTIALSLRLLLRDQMKFMQENGFAVFMVSAPDQYISELEKDENTDHISVPMTRKITPLTDLFCLAKMISLFNKIKPQIVHTHTPKAGIIGMLAGWICRVPVRIHTIAGLPLLESKGLKRRLLVKIERITYRLATQVNPNSKWIYNHVVQANWIKESKLKFIGNGSTNGVDVDFFKKSNVKDEQLQEVRSKLNIGRDDFIFIFIGRVVADKGINELVEAFLELRENNDKLKLLIVGSLEEDLDPISPAAKLSLEQSNKISFINFQQDVRPFLAISNALVLPSYREGFPNAPLQASAMGIPSIVTDISGSNELIEDGVNGFIVQPKDVESLRKAMKRMVENRKKSWSLGENARMKVYKYYNMTTVQKNILELYYSLLDEKVNVPSNYKTIS